MWIHPALLLLEKLAACFSYFFQFYPLWTDSCEFVLLILEPETITTNNNTDIRKQVFTKRVMQEDNSKTVDDTHTFVNLLLGM